MWRRTPDDQVEAWQERFSTWFLTSSRDLLAHLPAHCLHVAELRADGGWRLPVAELAEGGLVVVELDAPPGESAFRYLVLADALADLEPLLLDAWNKRGAGEAHQLADLAQAGQVLVWPPEEQYLLLSGARYFGGLHYAQVRRLQFDLETTGLDDQRDRIFMISLADSTGWRACLDTSATTEALLLEQFVALVRERDPDVLENHNIFGFDLRFLVRRAASLGVRLALGRDGSEPRPEADRLRVGPGGRAEPFTRWRVAGREVVDTLHAVRRYGAGAGDLRRHGLKEAARHFGLARADREYVPGPEIWATFRHDPERVRRYACNDVEEVDGLSRRLLPLPFALAARLPRCYERVATDTTPVGLLEPLLVSACLRAGQALPLRVTADSRMPRQGRGAHSRLYVRGVVHHVLTASPTGLDAHLLLSGGAQSTADHAGALPRVLRDLLTDLEAEYAGGGASLLGPAGPTCAPEVLLEGIRRYLGSAGGLFADPATAEQLTRARTAMLERLLHEVERVGGLPVELAGDVVRFAVAGDDPSGESALLRAARGALPPGVGLRVRERHRAVLAVAEGSRLVLSQDGAVAVIGTAFGDGRQERFGEQFLREAAAHLLRDDVVGLRRCFLATAERLRTGGVPLDDLCVRATLRCSSADYTRARRRDEACEVLLSLGIQAWRAGQRVRYFRHRSGHWRLLDERDTAQPADADATYYLARLRTVYCRHFAHAFRPADYERLFRLPETSDDPDDSRLAAIRPIAERLARAE